MTGEQRRITTNKFRAISSRLARSMADSVSKNGCFWAVFRTIVGLPRRCFQRGPLLFHSDWAIKGMQMGGE